MRTLAMDGYYRARENIGRYSRIFLGILSLVSEKHMLEYSQLLKGKAGKGQAGETRFPGIVAGRLFLREASSRSISTNLGE